MAEKNVELKQNTLKQASSKVKQADLNPINSASNRVPNFGGNSLTPNTDYKQDYLEMEESIHEYLTAKQVLIIIDNLEDVLREDEDSLRLFLTELLVKLPGISILTTSRQKVYNLGEITECLYELSQLSNCFSIKLLEKKCLRKITDDEIKELFEVPAPV